jgi:hypothetical protein
LVVAALGSVVTALGSVVMALGSVVMAVQAREEGVSKGTKQGERKVVAQHIEQILNRNRFGSKRQTR